MNNLTESKERALKTKNGQWDQLHRRHHIVNGRSRRKRKENLKALSICIAFVAVFLILAISSVEPAFSSTSPEVASGIAQPAVLDPQIAQNMNSYADYLFILAVPFAVVLMVAQYLSLNKISTVINKGRDN